MWEAGGEHQKSSFSPFSFRVIISLPRIPVSFPIYFASRKLAGESQWRSQQLHVQGQLEAMWLQLGEGESKGVHRDGNQEWYVGCMRGTVCIGKGVWACIVNAPWVVEGAQ